MTTLVTGRDAFKIRSGELVSAEDVAAAGHPPSVSARSSSPARRQRSSTSRASASASSGIRGMLPYTAAAMPTRKAAETTRRTGQAARPNPSDDGLPSSERVYRTLKDTIIEGALSPGTRLVELTLATRFGVSRTPVREALKRLVDGNLVLVDPVRGLVVRAPEAAEVEEVYLVREALDGLAARLAAKRLTPDDIARLRVILETMREGITQGRTGVIVNANIAFHDVIYGAAGNQTLSRLGKELRNFVRRFSTEAFASPSRVHAVLREHEELLSAMERGDAAAAERASSDHLRAARGYVAQLHLRKAVGAPASEATPA